MKLIQRLKKENIPLAEGWISIILNILLFCLKLWAGIMSSSVAVIADAWHTLSDSFTSIIVVVGAKYTRKPPDAEHPFGHGRAELIGAIIIGVLLGVAGVNFFVDSIDKLSERTVSTFPNIVVVIFAVSTVLKEGIAQFAFWGYRKTGTNALKADGMHHRSDALASLLILVGVLAGKHFWWSDGALGIMVAIFILHTAYEILKEGIDPLLGQIPKKELYHKVMELAQIHCDDCQHIHHLHIHCYGNHTELTFHMRFDPNMSIKDGHEQTTRLEKVLLKEMGIHATIHIEPDDPEYHQNGD